jgi:hypothetical protein
MNSEDEMHRLIFLFALALGGCSSGRATPASDTGLKPDERDTGASAFMDLTAANTDEFVFAAASAPIAQLSAINSSLERARTRPPAEKDAIVNALYATLNKFWFSTDGLSSTKDYLGGITAAQIIAALQTTSAITEANIRVWWRLPPPSAPTTAGVPTPREESEFLMRAAVHIHQCSGADTLLIDRIEREHESEFVRDAVHLNRPCTYDPRTL